MTKTGVVLFIIGVVLSVVVLGAELVWEQQRYDARKRMVEIDYAAVMGFSSIRAVIERGASVDLDSLEECPVVVGRIRHLLDGEFYSSADFEVIALEVVNRRLEMLVIVVRGRGDIPSMMYFWRHGMQEMFRTYPRGL